ncbi:hypothetical protein TRVL_07772 [Trypanosoma vivax]|nr:hypothetical protein TRVL_07772 [Trypanosoma vivax]
MLWTCTLMFALLADVGPRGANREGAAMTGVLAGKACHMIGTLKAVAQEMLSPLNFVGGNAEEQERCALTKKLCELSGGDALGERIALLCGPGRGKHCCTHIAGAWNKPRPANSGGNRQGRDVLGRTLAGEWDILKRRGSMADP